MSPQQRRGLVSGILFILLGVLFLLEALEVYEIAPATLWPVLLVALGIGILAGTGQQDDHRGGP